MKNLFLIIFFISGVFLHKSYGQEEAEGTFEVEINGEKYRAIADDGDTLILAELEAITLTPQTEFKSELDYKRYLRYKRYAAKVYPYAVKAVRIFRETEYVTQHMDKRHRRKHIKRLQDELKEDLRDNLVNLTKLQGTILTKMVERELDKPIYDLIASLRGNFIATYWQALGVFYNYNLKRGYVKGDDYIMDIVLKDFDVSYSLKSDILSRKEKREKRYTPIFPDSTGKNTDPNATQ